jgi:hypothetical protein
MWNLIAVLSLSPLLVFGIYHLMTWFNIAGVNQRVYWKRVALASAVAHVLLTTGFFVFVYFDYRANTVFGSAGAGYGEFLYAGSEFWRLSAIFDTAAMAAIVGLFAFLDRMRVAPPGLLALTIAITYLVGTVQWYLIGGGVGALLQRFWAGLKTTDDDEQWLQ